MVVLGATGALGQQLVPMLAERGATLILTGRHAGRLAALASTIGAATVLGDLATASARQRLYQAAEAQGRLDAIACLVGEASFGAFAACSDGQTRHSLAANLAIPMLAVKSLLPLLLRRQAGRICLVSSVWGYQPAAGEVTYSAAKAGLIGFGLALAEELAPTRIRVNVLAPAAFPSPMLEQFDASEREALAARQGGRLLSTQAVARRVMALLDPDLSASGRLVRMGCLNPRREVSPDPRP